MGELVARVLKEAGVGHVFTLCGRHILPIYDGCVKDKIGVIDVRPDRMVEALGGRGVLVRDPKDIGSALERALASDDVWCIDVPHPAAYRRAGQVSMAI